MKLTPAQARVLELIRAYWRRNGIGPTARELGRAAGYASHGCIRGHLKALSRKGAIEYLGDGTCRGIWPGNLRNRIRNLLAPRAK